MKITIGRQIKTLRARDKVTRERLAYVMEADEKTIRNWERNKSNPTVNQLVKLASYFQVSPDFLLTGRPGEPASKGAPSPAPDAFPVDCPPPPDDGKLRIIQFVGRRMVERTDYDPKTPIPLRIDAAASQPLRDHTLSIEIWGSAHIEGNVAGRIDAGQNVSCGNVAGKAAAGGNMAAGNIAGGVAVEGNLTCGDISGSVQNCGGNIRCRVIKGGARCEGKVHME